MSKCDAFIAGRNLFGDNVISFGMLALGATFTFAGIRLTPGASQAFTKIGPNRYTDGMQTYRTSRKSAVIEVAK